MGLFDTVWLKCPECSSKINIQTKAGSCELQEYYINIAPPDILGSLNGLESNCPECGKLYHIKVQCIVSIY